MNLSIAIDQAKQENRLGLVIYTIPSFPDPEHYAHTIQKLAMLDYVSIIETSLPSTMGFSTRTNAFLRNSIEKAQNFYLNNDLLGSIQTFAKPSLYLLYEGIVKHFTLPILLERIKHSGSAVMFVGPQEFQKSCLPVADKYGLETVPIIATAMNDADMTAILRVNQTYGFVYLMIASNTGGVMQEHDCIAAAINNIKRCNAEVKVAAGFGINSAEQITQLKKINNLDAIIIGTAFLQHLARGWQSAAVFLDEISMVL